VGDSAGEQRVLEAGLQAMHMRAGHRVEAGNCVLAVADALAWPRGLAASAAALSGFLAKRLLRNNAIMHMKEGGLWERALELLAEERHLLEDEAKAAAAEVTPPTPTTVTNASAVIADMIKLNELWARSITADSGKDRLFDTHFLVEFFGPPGARASPVDFPAGKKFVVRVDVNQKLEALIATIRRRWPIDVLTPGQTMAPETSTQQQQHRRAVRVRPCRAEKLAKDFAEAHGLPEGVWPGGSRPKQPSEYEANMGVNVFLVTTPLLRADWKTATTTTTAGNTDAKPTAADYGAQETYVVTRDLLPSIVRWAEVVRVVVMEKDPLTNATDSVEFKTEEMARAMTKLRAALADASVTREDKRRLA
jgi:hypothetical protein